MKTECKIQATLSSLVELEVHLLPLISDVDEDTRDTLRLVVQELGTNIVRHAYAGTAGVIEAQFEREGAGLRLEFRDYAPNAYLRDQEITLPDPNSLPNGGWGLFIIHQGVDQVEYEQLPNGNRWTLKKRL